MNDDLIAEIGIDERGSLYVVPERHDFPSIYRAAMEVDWDPARRRLFGPPPREWSYARWFAQILGAASDEYGAKLKLTPDTILSGVPAEIRAEIEAGEKGRNDGG